MTRLPIRLSKSRLMKGFQCEKALYLSMHQPGLAGKITDSQQALYDQGHEVGTEAQKRFPGGVLIDAPYRELEKAIEQTRSAIERGEKSIYEATFVYDEVQVKVDILHRAAAGAPWQIFEVKSSTSVKEEHLRDAAIQLWVLRSLGLEVQSASIMHINNQCVYPDLGDLFTKADVTRDAEALIPLLPAAVKNFKNLLAKAEAPDIDIGEHCSTPYVCDFQEHCWSGKGIPEISVFNIPGLSGQRKWELYREGRTSLDQLGSERLNPIQQRMVKSTLSGVRFVDPSAIADELSTWRTPLYYLDFETIAFAIPRYKGVRPYQQVPFQYSCHVQMKGGGPLLHREYLHETNTDPRRAIAESLVNAMGPEGSVVSYNRGFEGSILRQLAAMFSDLSDALLGIESRLVDPWPLVRNHVYDPKFSGSFSIKAVAPALLGADAGYDDLEVGDGEAAQRAYMDLISESATPDDKAKIRQSLLEYCRKDTLCMVNLVEWLENYRRS